MGIPLTGKEVTTGFGSWRLADGEVVEHWGMFDNMSMLQQLSLIPEPGQTEEASPT